MNTPTYAEIISTIRSKLNCGRDRIADTPVGFRWTYWPTTPTFEAQLLSDYGIPSENPELEESFRAEVTAIRETLEELGYEPKLAKWQRGDSEPGRRLMKSMNLAAEALNLWDEIGVPVRFKNGLVYRIVAPRDVLGSPIVDAAPPEVYVREVCEQTARDALEKELLKRRAARWRTGAILCGLVLAFLVFAFL